MRNRRGCKWAVSLTFEESFVTTRIQPCIGVVGGGRWSATFVRMPETPRRDYAAEGLCGGPCWPAVRADVQAHPVPLRSHSRTGLSLERQEGVVLAEPWRAEPSWRHCELLDYPNGDRDAAAQLSAQQAAPRHAFRRGALLAPR